jgi:hypothetical protein
VRFCIGVPSEFQIDTTHTGLSMHADMNVNGHFVRFVEHLMSKMIIMGD